MILMLLNILHISCIYHVSQRMSAWFSSIT